jgi:hypothetical protein
MASHTRAAACLIAASGILAQASPPVGLSGACQTIGPGIYIRTNGGANMSDQVMPGGAGSVITLINEDATGIEAYKAASGKILGSQANGYDYLCPGQSATYQSDGTNLYPLAKPYRCKFTADAALQISSSAGSATNDGLNAPLADPTAAYALAQRAFDIAGHRLTFNMADGAYGQILVHGRIDGMAFGDRFSSNVNFIGDMTTWANVALNTTQKLGTIYADDDAVVGFSGMKVSNSAPTNGNDLVGAFGAKVFYGKIEFGPVNAGYNHVVAMNFGFASQVDDIVISSSAGCHAIESSGAWEAGSYTANPIHTTLSGTPNFSSGFLCAQYVGTVVMQSPVQFLGTSTGPRGAAFLGGIINTGGQGLPGTTGVGVSWGGQYLGP